MEALVAAGILGIVVIGYMKSSLNISNTKKRMNVKHVMTDFSLEIARMLSNPENCAATFRAGNMSSTNLSTNPTLSAVLRPNNSTIYRVNSTYRDGGVKLNALSVTNYIAPVLAAPEIAGFTVAIEVQNVKSGLANPDRIISFATINMRVNASNQPTNPVTCFLGVHSEYVLRTGGPMSGQLIINLPLATPLRRGLYVRDSYVQTSQFYIDSDRRLKTQIIPVHDPLSQLAKINGYHFSWKKSQIQDFGVIAQEIEMTWPQLVTNQHTGINKAETRAVKYLSLLAPEVEAIKSLHAEKARINSQMNNLEHRLNTLKASIKR